MRVLMRVRASLVTACLLLILSVGPAQAAPLNLELLPFPDITSGFIDVTYDAVTDAFVAIGFALTLDTGVGAPLNITAGSYNITANITNSGGIGLGGGTLDIGGTIPTLSFTDDTQPLLTGNLTTLGFPGPPGGDIFEFLFTVTGGVLAPLFTPVVGTIMDGNFNGAFDGTFTQSFANPPFAGSNDTAPIPEPGTILLLLTGMGGLYSLRKLGGVRNS